MMDFGPVGLGDDEEDQTRPAQLTPQAPAPQPAYQQAALPVEPASAQLGPTFNQGAPPPGPPTYQQPSPDTGILQQARDYSAANPGFQIPGGQNTNFLGGIADAIPQLGREINYYAGAPGRTVDNFLPAETPPLLRDIAVAGANIAPFVAAGVATGGASVVPSIASGAGAAMGSVLAPLGANYLSRQGGVPGAIGDVLNTKVLPDWVPLLGGATPAQIGGGIIGGAIGARPGGAPEDRVTARPAEPPINIEGAGVGSGVPRPGEPVAAPARPPEAWEQNRGSTSPEPPRTAPTGMGPDEMRAYQAGYETARNDPTYGNPQYGWPDVGNGPQDNPLSNAHWNGVAAAQTERMANPDLARMQNEFNVREGAFGQPNPFNEVPPTPGTFTEPTAGFRQPADALTIEGASGDIHNVLGYLGDRGGQPYYATDGGPVGGVPLSELAAHATGPERAQLDQMRAGQGVPPTEQTQAAGPGAPAAQAFRESASGRAQAEQAAAGTNTPQGATTKVTGTPGTPQHTGGVLRALQEFAYAPFGFDIGTILRQGVTRILNPFRIGETVQVFKDAYAAGKTVEGSRAINSALVKDPTILAKFADGKNPLHYADVEGTGPKSARESNMSKALSWIPGYDNTWRANATILNSQRTYALRDFIKNNPRVSEVEALHYAHYAERISGHGSVPDALKPLGPLFTSVRYAASIPERIGYLLPLQRMPDGQWHFAGRIASEALKDQAGFIVTVAATMALAEQAGAKAGWDPFQQSDDKEGNPGFGVIKYGPVHVDLLGGARSYITTAVQMATGEKNGRPYPAVIGEGPFGLQGSLAEFGRNKIGPAAGLAFQGAKLAGVGGEGINFLRPDYWDQGVLGTGTAKDRAASVLTPLWMQDLARVIDETPGSPWSKAAAGAVGGALSFAGASVNSYPPSASSQVTQSGTQALADPAKLQQAFPDHPELAKILQGQKYSDLNSIEKNAVKAVLDPADLKALEDSNRKLSPAIAAHGDKLDQLRADRTKVEDAALDRLNAGTLTGSQVRELMKVTKDEYNKGKAAADADPAFKKEIEALQSSGTKKANAQDVVDTFWKIDTGDPKTTADMRNQYIRDTIQSDPAMGERLLFAIEPRNQSRLQAEYSSISPVLDQIFSLPQGSARSEARRADPASDAILNFYGYEQRTLTPQAAQILAGMQRHR